MNILSELPSKRQGVASEALRVPSLEIQSGRTKFSSPGRPGGGGGKRGKLTGEMSSGSRRRFQRRMACLDWEDMAARGVPVLFITLTTPEEYWTRELDVYLALRRFHDRLDYSYSDTVVGAFVRRERGAKRGMLHYHLMVFGERYISANWLRESWAKSLGHAGKVRVDVDRAYTSREVCKYLSKYMSKAAYEGAPAEVSSAREDSARAESSSAESLALSELHTVGEGSSPVYTGQRPWTVWNEKRLSWGEELHVEGDAARMVAAKMRRILHRWQVDKARARARKLFPGRLGVRVGVCLGRSGFAEFLRKSNGFTVLASPGLLSQVFRYAFSEVFGEACAEVFGTVL